MPGRVLRATGRRGLQLAWRGLPVLPARGNQDEVGKISANDALGTATVSRLDRGQPTRPCALDRAGARS